MAQVESMVGGQIMHFALISGGLLHIQKQAANQMSGSDFPISSPFPG